MTLQETINHYQQLINEGKLDANMPAFILVARDALAKYTVQHWSTLAHFACSPDAKVDNAMAIAETMGKWPEQYIPGTNEREQRPFQC